jgi:hypothetical protein
MEWVPPEGSSEVENTTLSPALSSGSSFTITTLPYLGSQPPACLTVTVSESLPLTFRSTTTLKEVSGRGEVFPAGDLLPTLPITRPTKMLSDLFTSSLSVIPAGSAMMLSVGPSGLHSLWAAVFSPTLCSAAVGDPASDPSRDASSHPTGPKTVNVSATNAATQVGRAAQYLDNIALPFAWDTKETCLVGMTFRTLLATRRGQAALAQQQVQARGEAGEAYEEHPYAGYDVDAAF